MSYSIKSTALAGVMLLAFVNTSLAQKIQHGTVLVPASSLDQGARRAHTNIRIFLPQGGFTDPQVVGPPASGLYFQTPASLGCIYKIVTPVVAGCNPNVVTANPAGGANAIAIVDAYDNPNAANDLAHFSTQFGIAAPNFTVVYAAGTQPAFNFGWAIEEALDIEWAHAMAPNAQLFLVEAASNSDPDLFAAEDIATSIIQSYGAGEISNSWGEGEFSGETAFDYHFHNTGVVYFASSGDSPGVSYPSASPNVVSAGGTSVRFNPVTGKFIGEVPWDEAGGGTSAFEPIPSYQGGISGIVGGSRGTPDFSSDSDPVTGVWVYFTSGGGWYVVGGTSVASPTLAGIVNLAGNFESSSNAENTLIYSYLGTGLGFNDIKTGFCGPYVGYSAVAGWDFCTGVGSDKGTVGK